MMQYPSKTYKKGFTLLELLVVIGIMSGLIIAALPNYNIARKKSRDVTRKSDLKQIQKALELYSQDNGGNYVVTASFPASGSTWSSGGTVYMGKVPSDPVSSNPSYKYTYTAASNSYTLCGCLENSGDTISVACSTTAGCFTAAQCSSNKCYLVTQP